MVLVARLRTRSKGRVGRGAVLLSISVLFLGPVLSACGQSGAGLARVSFLPDPSANGKGWHWSARCQFGPDTNKTCEASDPKLRAAQLDGDEWNLGGGAATAGSLGSVLTGPNGHTLYELSTEHNGTIDCTGSCVSTWPPLTVTAGQSAKITGSLSGTLGTVHRPEGTTQVTYNGHPVYYYSGDSAAGQANGQGVGGVWFALTPSGTAAASGGGATTTTSGGYSY